MSIFWLDVETTGIEVPDFDIIQIAAIYGDKTFNGYCTAGTNRDAKAMLISGLKMDQLSLTAEAEEPATLAARFLEFLREGHTANNGYKFSLGGHNVTFDLDHLEDFYEKLNVFGIRELFEYHYLDTMTLGKTLKEAGILPMNQRMALKELCEAFGIKITKQHDAFADITATKKLFEKIVDVLKSAG